MAIQYFVRMYQLSQPRIPVKKPYLQSRFAHRWRIGLAPGTYRLKFHHLNNKTVTC